MTVPDRKIYYACYYAEPENKDSIVSYPSVWSKIDYIVSCMKDCGYTVELVSVARSAAGRYKGFVKSVDAHETHRYFSSICSGNRVMQKVYLALFWFKLILFFLCKPSKDDILFVYHSLDNTYWLNILKKVFGKRFVLEIEDVFSALSPQNQSSAAKEWDMLNRAEGCLCVNDLIRSKLKKPEKAIISYGSYSLPDAVSCASGMDKKVRLVYAGVIEQVRKAAFLAVEAMRFLPENYELDILGFGQMQDIKALRESIKTVNASCGAERISYCGTRTGAEYYAFLQQHDIGLSTHMYDEDSMASADNTFPSKVLVYLANGLRVVAQKLDCLTSSALDRFITYYDFPSAENVARAIQSVDLSAPYDSREKIKQLDVRFRQELKQLLESV